MPKPIGLQNNGNTCYFNATLQNLHRTIVFRRNLEYINTVWKQKNQVTLVNESISSENGFLAKIMCSVKKLLDIVRNGEFRNCFFLFLAYLTLYKAGSSGVLISAARFILEHPFFQSTEQQLPFKTPTLYVDRGANCSLISLKEFLESWGMCPKIDRPDVIRSSYDWIPNVLLASGILGAVFISRGKRRSRYVTDWWPSGDKVVLCCSGVLFYCIGHLRALSQPIYDCLRERNPEALYIVFFMASSTCLLFHRLHITEVILGLFQNYGHQLEEPISVALAKLFADIDYKSGTRYHNPRLVLEAVCRRSHRFHGFHQQDSHEVLRHLLDGIREEERNLNQRANCLTLVDKVFGGHFRTIYTCQKCASPHCLYEAFLDISLPVTLHEDTLKEISDFHNDERNVTSAKSQEHSVEFWLKVFTRSENLGQQYLCSACNRTSTGNNYILTHGQKQTLICDPPAILCIHIKRFRNTAGDFVKVNDHVEFSEYLDLKPYLTNDHRRLGENQKHVWYSLFGVVVHSGSLNGGHYTAYIKSQDSVGQGTAAGNTEEFLQQDGFDWDSLSTEGIDELKADPLNIPQNPRDSSQTQEWYYCSDSTVMQVNASDVFKQEAYLLFYERLC